MASSVLKAATAFTVTLFAMNPAHAGTAAPDVGVTKCERPYGSIALTDGDQQGWNQMNLASPRPMLTALVQESGCFTMHDPSSGRPADFLLAAIAGSKEEVDQSMSAAKTALTEGLVRSGAATQVLGRVPMAGAMLSMFGGLGGKKRTILAGLRIVSPATGQTLVTGTGQTQKSTIKIMGASDWVSTGQGTLGQYATSNDGKMLTAAFVQAYNSLMAQGSALTAAPKASLAPAPVAAATTSVVAIDTSLWAQAAKAGTPVRTLRAGTQLTLTGGRSGLFVEAADSYGTKGWVSVEDLR